MDIGKLPSPDSKKEEKQMKMPIMRREMGNVFPVILCFMTVFVWMPLVYAGQASTASLRSLNHFLSSEESGTVTSIGNREGVTYITVTTPDQGAITVSVGKNSTVLMCDQYISHRDVAVGDRIDISYFDNGRRFVANAIYDYGPLDLTTNC